MHQQICVQDEFEINALNIHEHSSAFLSRTTQPYVCCLQPLEDSYHMNDTHWVGWKEVHAPLCAHHFPSKGETSVELLQCHGLTKPRFDGGGFLAHFPFFRKISQFNFIKDILAGPRICWFQQASGLILLSWNRLNNPRANTVIVVLVINLVIPKSLMSYQTLTPPWNYKH